MDYLVLSQHAQKIAGGLRYRDVECALYHYPRVYFELVEGYEAFLYYRPSKGAAPNEASCYVGYGRLLDWFPDLDSKDHRFVRIADCRHFARPVPYAETDGSFYESGYSNRSTFQGRSVRRIGAVDFFRILSAAAVRGDPFARLGNVDTLESPFDPMILGRLPRDPPREPLVAIDAIPEGAGYIPSGRVIDLYESAALQERARADHQRVLRTLHREGARRGATALYNNNIDLLLKRADGRVLIEAKSLNEERDAVDRMRYGMGQLLDYGVRYRADLAAATPLLAFGRIPQNDVGWIASILESNGIGFAGARRPDEIVPLNETARATFLFR
ncbi:MAG: hypothetical protein ACREM2_00555 [Vulcanimicrobiaceae bacterium]